MSPTFKAWLPVIIWMGIIFFMSTDVGSSAHTSRIIGPLLHWLVPDISDSALEIVQTVIRKGGHLTEYAVLGCLTLRAFRMSFQVPSTSWSWRAARYAVLFAAVYASTDEFHQTFVPSRGPSPVDVMIDTCGAMVGIALVYAYRKYVRPTPPLASAG